MTCIQERVCMHVCVCVCVYEPECVCMHVVSPYKCNCKNMLPIHTVVCHAYGHTQCAPCNTRPRPHQSRVCKAHAYELVHTRYSHAHTRAHPYTHAPHTHTHTLTRTRTRTRTRTARGSIPHPPAPQLPAAMRSRGGGRGGARDRVWFRVRALGEGHD